MEFALEAVNDLHCGAHGGEIEELLGVDGGEQFRVPPVDQMMRGRRRSIARIVPTFEGHDEYRRPEFGELFAPKVLCSADRVRHIKNASGRTGSSHARAGIEVDPRRLRSWE